MALTIYPANGHDSFISLADANVLITSNSLHGSDWTALDDAVKEVYLRIASTNILNTVSTDITNVDGYLDETVYVATDSCIPHTTAIMAIHDLVYGLSSTVNPNKGLVTKEKVGDLEVTYYQGEATQVNGRVTSPFPLSARMCLNAYGANISARGFTQTTLVTK